MGGVDFGVTDPGPWDGGSGGGGDDWNWALVQLGAELPSLSA
jgi:hypothetical protein